MARVTFVSTPLKLFGDIFNDSYVLDLSMFSYCFQSCFYCFANLNKVGLGTAVGSQDDPTDAYIRKLQKAHGQGYDPTSMVETFIRNRYVTIYSNNVDPFYPAAEQKHKVSERLLREWALVKQPVFIQTKEVYTPELFDLLVACKEHIVVYVTITTLLDEVAKETEKYAPPPAERLRRIESLSKAGVDCVVGLNPYLRDWVPDIQGFFKACADAGAKGVCTQTLHLTKLQSRSIAEKFKPYIAKANDYEGFDADKDLMEQAAAKYGLKLTYGRKLGDEFVKGNTGRLPQFEGDAHWLHDNLVDCFDEYGQKPVIVTWPEVEKFYGQFSILKHVFRTEEILQVIARDNDRYHHAKHALGKRTSLLNVMHYLWNDMDYTRGIANYADVKLMLEDVDHENKVETVAVDDNGDVVRVLAPFVESDVFEDNEENAPNGMVEWSAPEPGNGVMPWAYCKED